VEGANGMSQEIGSVTEWHCMWPVITHTGDCAPV